MSTVGIIAEFNPFHNGHKYLISKAKEITNADTVICIMSGDFTQAGNISIENKFQRAKRVIENGADLVIELPVIYAVSSAEYFSSGAVDILNKLNCIDYLCFGSETGVTDDLIFIAKTLIEYDEQIWRSISVNMKEGISFAVAREKAISTYLTEEQLQSATTPNNILAIEYIKRIIKTNSNITPIAIKRTESDSTISATEIRELIKSNKEYQKYLPDYSIPKTEINVEDYFNTIVKYIVIKKGAINLKGVNEVTEGLENKIHSAYSNTNNTNYEQTLSEIKSKRYQMSKIKRIFLNILLDISKEDFSTLYLNFGYARILSVNVDKKNSILSALNKQSTIPIITSINDKILNSLDDNDKKALNIDIVSHNIYSMLNNCDNTSDYKNKL